MPTNKTISQVSINIDLEERGEGKGEFETIDLMPQIQLNFREVAKYDRLTVESSNTNDVVWIYTGKRRYPSFWFFLWIFGPVLLLSVLTPLPFYAFRTRYEHVQNWPVATCYTTSMQYNPDDLYLRITAAYTDSQQARHYAEFFYSMGYDLDVDNYLLNFYEVKMTYPCYYKGDKFYDTGFPSFLISYANDNARNVTLGLFGCWAAIVILVSLAFCIPWFLDNRKRVITKEIFEKSGENYLEVQDWGTVDSGLKQILYSVVYSSCVPETNPEQVGKKAAKFITFTRHSATTLVSTIIFGAFAFIFFASIIVMFAFAFAEKTHVFMIMLMWCIISIITIIPFSLLFLILFTIYKHPYINATAVVNCITPQPGDMPETVSIFGKYYYDKKLGHVLKATVRRA